MLRSFSAFAIPVARVTPSALIASINGSRSAVRDAGLRSPSFSPSLTPELSVLEILDRAAEQSD
jgi:hypothetical protein